MPNHIRVVSIPTDRNGEGHIKITLDLNINLNSHGLSATIAPTEEPADEFSYEVPAFAAGERVGFGKAVREDM